ncbi:hypothetical protein RA307_31730 [Xanthobacteraceae bacterium Astr-EGSB]|uniref:hypothetical protein n=1 Tax=Astrobacterium formosum TaxID=3069710 RepID=UPI0027B1E489|nr:hypothetical protein [Xanthobacteraceae bacterium Astr-EGSB]
MRAAAKSRTARVEALEAIIRSSSAQTAATVELVHEKHRAEFDDAGGELDLLYSIAESLFRRVLPAVLENTNSLDDRLTPARASYLACAAH